MLKNYVLDTNVLLLDPEAMFKFEDNNVIIPIGVIEELDRFKKESDELGRNARQVSRLLDDLREHGDLSIGVKHNESTIKVRYNGNLEQYFKEKHVDLHVIHIAHEIIKKEPSIPCIIVSKDINVRIRANALGLKAENYEAEAVEHNDIDKGYTTLSIDEYQFNTLAEKRYVEVAGIEGIDKFSPNYFFILQKDGNPKKTLLGRLDDKKQTIKSLTHCTKLLIRPMNKEQEFIVDALMDNSIKLVCIVGKAGSGKTILSTAVGYFLSKIKGDYKRLLVSRPVFPLGKDIGYLPGDINEKLDPWMCPIYDAFDIINPDKQVSGKSLVDGVNVIVEPLTYIRGRSIHDNFIIVDEAQNLSKHEIKTIVSRAGENTKVVLTGDIYQIDNPYLDSLSNGLSVVINKMTGSSIFAHIMLEKCVRSQLADEIANKL